MTGSDRNAPLRDVDPDVHAAIGRETRRQQSNLELIASENFVSEAVLEAQGSILTNKYAEGYPGRRYYGGCEFVDEIEQLAIDRAKALFGAEAANVFEDQKSVRLRLGFKDYVTAVFRRFSRRRQHAGHPRLDHHPFSRAEFEDGVLGPPEHVLDSVAV